jgi:hypothetical protein
MYTATINFHGDYGNKNPDGGFRIMRFPWTENIIDNAKTFAMRNVMNTYSQCSPSWYSHTEKACVEVAAPGVGANLDIKARIYFKHPTSGKIHRVEIPAPIDSMFEEQEQGDRVKQADLEAIVSAISTCYSVAFIPLYGLKIQRA